MIDHYAVLGLPKFTPTPNEIKKSFRKLAIKWHPDKCKASNANDIFSNISTAYEILYDEDSKRKYDRELRLASTIASVASCTTTMYNTNTSNFPRRSSSAGSSQCNNDTNSYHNNNNNNSNSSSYRYKKNVNKNRFKQRKKHNYQYSRKHTSGFDQWHYDYRNPQHNNNNNNNNRASMSQGSSRSNHSNYTSSSADEDDDMYYSSSSSQNSSRASSRASSSNAGETSRVANAFANVFGDGDFEKAADHWDNMMYVNHLPCLPTYLPKRSIYLSIYLFTALYN